MKTVKTYFLFLLFIMIVYSFYSCNKYYAYSSPYKDWSNTDSIFVSYDTLDFQKPSGDQLLIRFWIDPSSTVKTVFEVIEKEGGLSVKGIRFGYVYNKKNKKKYTYEEKEIIPNSNQLVLRQKIDSLKFMDFKTIDDNWQNSFKLGLFVRVWYRVEYYNRSQKNKF